VRQQAVASTLDRTPNAFRPKINPAATSQKGAPEIQQNFQTLKVFKTERADKINDLRL
jgi:hypothetical protein